MKFHITLLAVMLLAVFHAPVLAYGGLWLDRDADFRAIKKLVLFPMSISDDLNQFATDADESSAVFQQNDYLHRRLSKKLKKANLLRLAPDIGEQRIREDAAPFRSLLAPVQNAAARAKDIQRLTMANGYLIPHFRENWVRTDISPETVFHFTLRSWTERRDENGVRVTDESSQPVTHIVPEREMKLRIMDMDYRLFDEKGHEILSFENSAREYFADPLLMYKDLAEEFVDALKDAQKGKYALKDTRKDAVPLGLSALTLPPEMVEDEIWHRALRFALYDEAGKKDRLDPGGTEAPRLLVEADIHRCELVPTWNPPTAWVTTDSSSQDESWTDKQGKRHQVTVTEYTQSVSHAFGYYSYHAEAEGILRLVDAATGEVIFGQPFSESDDKRIDACRHAFQSFFKDVEKYVRKD